MEQTLLAYLTGGLDEAEQTRIEAVLQKDAEAHRKLARLKLALAPLAEDRDEVAPPPDLATRTLARIAAEAGRPLPRAPHEPASALPGRRLPRVDWVVAACLLLVVLATGAVALYRWQSGTAALVACQNNLRQFYVALATYRDQHDRYPDPAAEAPRNVAGMVVPVLADAKVLPPSFTVRCPAMGSHLNCQVSLADVRTMSEDEFQAASPSLSLCYAFSLGYRDQEGYHDAWSVAQRPTAAIPILADRPPSGGAPGNSMNHGGTGQNVLFLDGHVRFTAARIVGGDDDIFLNNEQRVAAGLGANDVVLGYSAARP